MNRSRVTRCFRPFRPQAGLTLIEVLTAILILGVIVGLGGPSFIQLVQNNRIETRVSAVLQLINQARAEATAQRRVVTVCGSLDGATCSDDVTAWSNRVISFVDCDGDGVLDPAGGAVPCAAADTVLLNIENGSPGVTTRLDGFANGRFSFGTQGFLVAPGTGTVRFCDSRGATSARALNIAATGRVNAATDINSPTDGVVNDHSRANVTCP